MNESSPYGISSDTPLSSKAEDKLNRGPFAEHIARVLRDLPNGTGLVVGIHGPWGDGKTTALNMIKTELDGVDSVATIEFNPWRFTDETSLLAEFYNVLAAAIRARLSTTGEEAAGWLSKLARIVSVATDSAEKVAEVLNSYANVDVETLRARLSSALILANKRIVILIDDIDRLDKHETHTVFRLIKACADFPNVCYVLAFDDVTVAKALGERYGSGDEASGRAFLEKIIQVPLKLPVAMKEDLRSLCFQQVEQALTAAGVELTREEVGGFVSGFDRGISIRLDTPRVAKRYGNALMFALPMLKGEINTLDLILIEAVRTFYPAVYDCIRANHTEFSGVEPEYQRRGRNGSRAVELLDPIVGALPAEEQEAVKSLLKDLFPRLGSAYGGMGHGSDWLRPWAKAKRICSPDYCPRYFSYAVPQSDVRDSEMDAVYANAAAGKEDEVRKTLETYFTGGKARRVIERMREREKDTATEPVRSLCLALAKLGTHIPNPPSLFSFAEPVTQAAILISHLIRRLPAGPRRVTLAEEVIAVADPLWFGGECVRWLHVTDENDKAEHNTLTKAEVNRVGKTLVERIKVRSATGEPLFSVDVPQEQSLLFDWWRAKGRKPVQKHLVSVFATDTKTIAQFLQAMAPRSWGQQDVLPSVGELGGDQLKNIKLIYDLDALAKLIRKHLPGDFENPQWRQDSNTPLEQRLAEQFMFVYKKWKKEGEPPDATPVIPSEPSAQEPDADDEAEETD